MHGATMERTAAHPVAGVTAPATPRRSRFRGDIEGLRAVAVVLVLLDHVFGWPSGGFIGVDVFFVISGFLITGLLVRERARTGRISFRAFYARRARRLLPAAVTTLVVTTAAAWLIFLDGRFRETVTDGLWALFFAANVNFAQQGTDYFAQTAAVSPFQHFWSLAVEEQFYLVWPVLVLAVFALPLGRDRGRGVALAVAMTGVGVASFLWSIAATAASPGTAYFSTFTRAWELAVGALVAVLADRLWRLPRGLRATLAWTGLAGIVVSAFVITARTPFPGAVAALPVFSTALLVAFGDTPGGPGVRWALGSRPARFLGRISYSLSLWHWPVVVVLAAVVPPASTAFYVSAVLVSLVLATVSHHVVEQPVLHSTWLLPQRGAADERVFRRAKVVGAGFVVALTVACTTLSLAFPPGRLDPRLVDAANAQVMAEWAAQQDGDTDDVPALQELSPLGQEIADSLVATAWGTLTPSLDVLPTYLRQQWSEGCFDVSASSAEECVTGSPTAAQRAVVLGDSVAGAWLPGIRAGLEPRGWSVQTLGMGQCPNITATVLADSRPFTECSEHRTWAVEYIAETRPALVVLANAYNAELADDSADKPAEWRSGLTAVVQQIQQSGARVVVLASPPPGANLQSCATALSSPVDCVSSPPDTWHRYAGIEEEVAAATGAAFVDPVDWFCVQDRCPAVVGTTPVFADGLHMTAEYSEKIATQLADTIAPAA